MKRLNSSTRNFPFGRARSCLLVALLVIPFVASSAFSGLISAQEKKENGKETEKKESDSDDKKSPQQAWEFWAYDVKTWIVSDLQFETEQVLPDVISTIERKAYVTDASSWKVKAERAPADWNWRLLKFIDNVKPLEYLSAAEMKTKQEAAQRAADRKAKRDGKDPKTLPPIPSVITPMNRWFSEMIDGHESLYLDKLIVVSIQYREGRFICKAREYDLRTRKWGAKTEITCENPQRVGETAYRAMSNAFMPLARIEKAFDKQNFDTRKTERWARLRVRAIGVTKTVERDEDGNLVTVDNTDSPVWVRSNDVFQPVVRRLTRELAFEKTQTIAWTFLVIREKNASTLECRTQSRDRVPLSGRTGTRIEKLALVIRPPNRPTKLQIFARQLPGVNKEPDPLAEYEVFSRSPGDSPDVDSELIGKTDFFGNILVPPSENGIRLLMIRSGYRGLAKLPMVPGLYDEIEIELPNDEDRLYAEGIVRGLHNEITDLLAQRKVIITRIEKMLDKGEIDQANDLYDIFSRLDDAQSMRLKIDQERTKLISADETQSKKINAMFDKLSSTLNTFMPPSERSKLEKMVVEARQNQINQQAPKKNGN